MPIKNFEKSSHGRSQGLPKIFRAPIHRAHRAVVFAIAQLSCSVYTMKTEVSGLFMSKLRNYVQVRKSYAAKTVCFLRSIVYYLVVAVASKEHCLQNNIIAM